jgi:hypothetical protein
MIKLKSRFMMTSKSRFIMLNLKKSKFIMFEVEADANEGH